MFFNNTTLHEVLTGFTADGYIVQIIESYKNPLWYNQQKLLCALKLLTPESIIE